MELGRAAGESIEDGTMQPMISVQGCAYGVGKLRWRFCIRGFIAPELSTELFQGDRFIAFPIIEIETIDRLSKT